MKKPKGICDHVDWKHFDGGNHCVLDRPDYTAEQVMKNFRAAEKLYEVGFNKRYSQTAKDNFNALTIDSADDILVFRSSRMKQVNDVVGSLSDQFSRNRITTLAQPTVKDELRQNPNIDEVLVYEEGHFKNTSFPSELMQTLQKRRFSMGVIPYNNISGNGYADVKAIANRIGIRKLVAVNIEGKVFDLDNPGDHGRSHI